MREFKRTDRLASQLQRELSSIIRDEIDDPRADGVTISGVRVTRDLAQAKVFVSTLDRADEADEIVKALLHANSFMRVILSRRLHIRHIPDLKFIYDESIERGEEMSELIARAVGSDSNRSNVD